MKKTILTVCSVAALCAVIFLACTKEDNGNKQVSYASQQGYGGGNNPNPNNNPSSSGNTTNTNTIVTCVSSLSVNSASCTGAAGSHGANTISETGGSCGSNVLISFAGTSLPVSGTYTIVTGSPASTECTFTCGTPASGGSVTITTGTGTNNKAVFTGIICGANTVSGSVCY